MCFFSVVSVDLDSLALRALLATARSDIKVGGEKDWIAQSFHHPFFAIAL